MKILHTADLHLKGKEHTSILESIIYVANREEVDLIIIAGDLFDVSFNGRVLESSLLSVWEKFKGDILVIPGNHDFKYLKNRTELASNVIIANQEPFSVAQIDDVYFVCVPFQEGFSLADINIPYFEPSILIVHGTFNSSRENNYFPIAVSDVAGRYNYVALGHYHTWCDRWEEGTLIVNPGAPRQTKKSDKGERFVALIDTDTWMMERVGLPISFTEYKTINISITDSQEEIKEKLLFATKELKHSPYSEVELIIQGSVIFSQYSLSEQIQKWKDILVEQGIDIMRVHWDIEKITQISKEIVFASFTRLLVDKITDNNPDEVNELIPFLFERLQQENQKTL